MDSYGQNLTYTLESLTYTTATTHPQADRSLVFQFVHGNNTIYVEIPFSATVRNNRYFINLGSVPDGDALQSIRDFVTGNSNQLSSFNVLNNRDIGHFYTVATGGSPPNQVATLLTSTFIFYSSSFRSDFTATGTDFLTGHSFNQLLTGDLLCYGSLNTGVVTLFIISVPNSSQIELAFMDCLDYYPSLLAL